MAQNPNLQNNQKKTTDEKLKFLKREEINTMQKDVSRLREAESREERKKISQVKTSEEIKEEKEKRGKIEKIPVEVKIPEKKPEIKKENIPEEKRKETSGEFEFLAEEKEKIEHNLSRLAEEKISLEKELKQLQAEIENIQSAELNPVLKEERKIEDEKKIIEGREKEAIFQDRQTIEENRWEVERKRKLIEEQKWQIEEKLEERNQKIKKINLRLSEIANKEKEFSVDIQNLSERAKGIEFQKERLNLRESLMAIDRDLEQIETDFQSVLAQKTTAKKNWDEILTSEKALEEEISILEEKEAKAATLAEQKEIEQKRWETDKIRKETEEEKWQQQAKNKEIEQQFTDIGTELEKKKKEKIILENKIKEIDAFLEKTGIKSLESEPKPEPIQKTEIKIPVTPIPPPPPPPSPPPIFKPEQKISIPRKEIEQVPLSGIKRVLLRLGILVVLIAIASFLIWFFMLKNRIGPVSEPTPSPSPSPTETPEVIIPQPLIATTETETLDIKTYAELQSVFFENALQPKKNQEQFTRILIKNTAENQFLGLKEFFEALEVAAPEGFYDKIDNDFTLFAYSASDEVRLGFVAKIKNKDGLADLMKNWEKTMEKDFNALFVRGLKENQPALSRVFKDAYFKEQSFRYQTFTKNDFGICYGIINDYLVFTTSGKSMLKTIDLLPS